MSKMRSPAQLTMRRLRKEGFNVQFCQTWNHYSKRSNDLLGFIDVLGFIPGLTLAIQATSSSNLAARVKKIKANEKYRWAKEAGWKIQAEGWRLKDRKYISRIVEL